MQPKPFFFDAQQTLFAGNAAFPRFRFPGKPLSLQCSLHRTAIWAVERALERTHKLGGPAPHYMIARRSGGKQAT